MCKAQVNAGCAQLSSIYVEINRGELECFVELQQIDQIQMVNAHTIGLQQHVSSAGQRIAITRVKRAFKEAEQDVNFVSVKQEYEKYRSTLEESQPSNFYFKDVLEIAVLADAHASYTKRHAEVNVFFIHRMRELEVEGHVKTEQLPYLIKLLYLISNIYFRKEEFQFSLNFLKEKKIKMALAACIYERLFELRYLIHWRWLKVKMAKQPIYATTLEMIKD